ncbi:MAG: hypothetical protein ACOYL6_08695 [Bacteriovoracaceae bacterium]
MKKIICLALLTFQSAFAATPVYLCNLAESNFNQNTHNTYNDLKVKIVGPEENSITIDVSDNKKASIHLWKEFGFYNLSININEIDESGNLIDITSFTQASFTSLSKKFTVGSGGKEGMFYSLTCKR